jgi:hypothetical protein
MLIRGRISKPAYTLASTTVSVRLNVPIPLYIASHLADANDAC